MLERTHKGLSQGKVRCALCAPLFAVALWRFK